MNFSFGHPTQQIYGFFTLAIPVGFKVISAIICGGLIGIEREFKNKPAGLKTNILICLGSALYTTMSLLIAQSFVDTGYHGDPARLAAQIIPGIGFIGAGAIMQSRASVVGITTAATIWIVAAIGVCIGAGYSSIAFAFTTTVLFTLLAIDRVGNKMLGHAGANVLEIIFNDDEGKTRSEINQAMTRNEIDLNDFEISRKENYIFLRLQYICPITMHKRFVLELWSIKGIREVKQL